MRRIGRSIAELAKAAIASLVGALMFLAGAVATVAALLLSVLPLVAVIAAILLGVYLITKG